MSKVKRIYKPLPDDGKMVLPKGKHYFQVACCDCGLVHRVYYMTPEHEDNKDDSLVTYWDREDRATAQVRRYGDCNLLKDKNKKWKLVRKGDDKNG